MLTDLHTLRTRQTNIHLALAEATDALEIELLSESLKQIQAQIDALSEDQSPLAAAKLRLRQLKQQLRELPANPGNQEGYDALDDLRHDIHKTEKEIKRLTTTESLQEGADEYKIIAEQVAGLVTSLRTSLASHAAQQRDTNTRVGDLKYAASELKNLIKFLS